MVKKRPDFSGLQNECKLVYFINLKQSRKKMGDLEASHSQIIKKMNLYSFIKLTVDADSSF